ncbi:MAG: M28 family peptidase, partial [Myxococcaceae bacterium]|nr:M28 family peptidase [Myxococcaceae bacterium]
MKHFASFVLALVAAASLVHALTHRAPPPLPPEVLERVRGRLAQLAQAPHPLGSAAHQTAQAQLAAWAAEDGATVEQHRGTGTRQDGDLTVLFDAPVVLARVEGTTPGAKALVVDAHFDSAAESPGASDNGVAVVAALEALRALARHPGVHPVVFAFDGSEEERLTGANAALTHPWVATAGAHLNLDAVGRAGRPVVFRASAAARPLLLAYARTVPAAHASVLGRDLVESGAVPSETDHRIYDELGHVPGLDVALYEDGAAYHTPLDGPAGVSDEVLTRVVGALVGFIPEAAALPSLTEDGAAPWVFFDVLGLGLLAPGPLLLLLVALAAAGVSLFALRRARARIRPLGAALLALVLSVLAAAVAGALVVFVLRGPHFWFAHPPLALAYGVAAAVAASWSSAWLGRDLDA